MRDGKRRMQCLYLLEQKGTKRRYELNEGPRKESPKDKKEERKRKLGLALNRGGWGEEKKASPHIHEEIQKGGKVAIKNNLRERLRAG